MKAPFYSLKKMKVSVHARMKNIRHHIRFGTEFKKVGERREHKRQWAFPLRIQVHLSIVWGTA